MPTPCRGVSTEALTLLQEARALDTAVIYLSAICEAYFLIDHAADASDLAQQALAYNRAHRRYSTQAQALWLLGNIAMQHDLPASTRPQPTTNKPWLWPRHAASTPPDALPPGPWRPSSLRLVSSRRRMSPCPPLRHLPRHGHDLLGAASGGTTGTIERR